MNILFVCTGNTCRSPMAEVITRALAAEQHKDVTTVSARVFAAYGAKPTEQAVEASVPLQIFLIMNRDH